MSFLFLGPVAIYRETRLYTGTRLRQGAWTS
jgi:hypothetical protein